MELNLATLAKHFSDEGAAWDLVESMRWPNGPSCPHCGDGRAYPLKARTTSTGRASYRKVWKCAVCRKQFSVLVGTIFEGTQVPLSKWLLAMYLATASKNGVAAYELHRTLGVTHKTAWYMLHRIREAMKIAPFPAMMSGVVVSDATRIGGEPKNRHWDKRVGSKQGKSDKATVHTLIEAETGEARSTVVPDVTAPTLHKAIAEQVDMAATTLDTDTASTYPIFAGQFAADRTVNHFRSQYVGADGQSTNKCENYFSQLKRSIDGTHHHVSKRHLGRYLSEYDFRYSTSRLSDGERLRRVMAQTGDRRLSYKRLTADD